MKYFVIPFCILFLAYVQNAYGQLIDHPRPSLILQMNQTSGTNASAIAYNPDQHMYYSIIAGNGIYPLEVFDGNGNNIFQTSAGIDMRGIWWNPKTKALEGNAYGDVGIVSYVLDKKSLPGSGTQTVFSGNNHQPDQQSVGTYDFKKKRIMYYSSGYIHWYSRSKGNETGKLALDLGSKVDDYNVRTAIYTGVKNMEIGLLDFENNEIHLFSAKSGKRTATVSLPTNAVTSDTFRFSYANKQVFLYNVDSRSWTGYKIFT